MKASVLFVLALSFGLAGAAQASTSTLPRWAAPKAPSQHSTPAQDQEKPAAPADFRCDARGASCYAEDSWTCCSGLCINQQCD
ncbi:MAG: hypothetical protein ACXVCG_12560 [Bdellovibrionota bacterium]